MRHCNGGAAFLVKIVFVSRSHVLAEDFPHDLHSLMRLDVSSFNLNEAYFNCKKEKCLEINI